LPARSGSPTASAELVIDGEVLHVNLELLFDAATGAAVGVDVRDEEDAAALVAAFEDGVTTTGEPPLALLVDNRPSRRRRACADRARPRLGAICRGERRP
jgi:chorismate synthase